MSANVRLRAPAAADVPMLDAWDASLAFKGEFNDFGQPPKSNAERAENGFIDGQHGTLIVETEAGEPIGTVDWRPAMYGPRPIRSPTSSESRSRRKRAARATGRPRSGPWSNISSQPRT
jgi:hypothetical protein